MYPVAIAPKSGCPDFARYAREGQFDEGLVEQMVGCFAGRLEAFARQRCRDEALAQDALQDALASAVARVSTFRGDSPIEPWLRTILASACSRLTRGRKNNPIWNQPLEGSPLLDRNCDESRRVALLDLGRALEHLEAVLNELPELNRELLSRHELRGLEIATLAAEFELTPEAVKARLKRSRALVRERLRARGVQL